MSKTDLPALLERLRDHAEMHSHIEDFDGEQKQWKEDLLEAVRLLESALSTPAAQEAETRAHEDAMALLAALRSEDRARVAHEASGSPVDAHSLASAVAARRDFAACLESNLRQYFRATRLAAQEVRQEPVAWTERVVKLVEFIAHLARINNDEAIPQAMRDLRKLLAAAPQPPQPVAPTDIAAQQREELLQRWREATKPNVRGNA